jgi:carbonic anhydrase
MYPHQPAVNQGHSDLEATIKANTRIQAVLIRNASTVISNLVRDKKLKVTAGYYDLATGNVAFLD